MTPDRTRAEDVNVLEIELTHAEVLIADIAAAHDRRDPIGDEQLVVHAAVDARKIRQQLGNAPQSRTMRVGIEEPHVDVGVGIESCD